MKWINHYHRWDVLLKVDPKRLLQVADNSKSLNPNPRKLSRLSEGFRDGEVDAPIVRRSCCEGITFVDGRHRIFLAAQLGFPTIKIAVLPEEIEFIRGFLKGVPNI